jgi:hypothetical protein
VPATPDVDEEHFRPAPQLQFVVSVLHEFAAESVTLHCLPMPFASPPHDGAPTGVQHCCGEPAPQICPPVH